MHVASAAPLICKNGIKKMFNKILEIHPTKDAYNGASVFPDATKQSDAGPNKEWAKIPILSMHNTVLPLAYTLP